MTEKAKIKIDIKLGSNATIPKKHSALAAGYDLYSANSENIILAPKSLELIPTDFSIAIPEGFEAQVRPRSGLALKHKIGVLNSPGTIDADYRGKVGIILYNFGDKDFVITSKMRIAQMVFAKHENVDFEITEQLPDTERGEGGFGHTKS